MSKQDDHRMDAISFFVSDDYCLLEKDGLYLAINRPDGSMQVSNRSPSKSSGSTFTIFGVMGMIHFLSSPYLVVITERELVGPILNGFIWRIKSSRIFPLYNKPVSSLTPEQDDDEKKYSNLLQYYLKNTQLYYSTDYKLTKTFQSQKSEVDSLQYLSNKHLLSPFLSLDIDQQHVKKFLAFCIEGFVAVSKIDKSLSITLISRRAAGRVGTRYFRRGLDDAGQAANHIETEQIFSYTNKSNDQVRYFGFVQIRASIPVFWYHRLNLKYQAPVQISDRKNLTMTISEHMKRVKNSEFSNVLSINLVDKHGREGDLASLFQENLSQNDNSKYIHFDFHHQCNKMRWDRISLLINQIREIVIKYGWFDSSGSGSSSTSNPSIIKQIGVTRTNCIDCLDRTNLVQSMIGLHVAGLQIPDISMKINFIKTFKSIWADNGDAISLQYAGTFALKGSYTRHGKITIIGLLKDGYFSLKRYFLARFSDGQKQDAYDLYYGNFRPKIEAKSPFYPLPRTNLFLFMVLCGILTGLTFLSVSCILGKWICSLIGLSITTMAIRGYYLFGNRFIRYPQLCNEHSSLVKKSFPSSKKNSLDNRLGKVHVV